ncbi:retinaldehyde-binding protein 1 [Nannochloropsis oceanica]
MGTWEEQYQHGPTQTPPSSPPPFTFHSNIEGGQPLSVSTANSSFDEGVTPLLNLTDEEATILVDRMRVAMQADDASLPQATRVGSACPPPPPLPRGFLLQCLRSRSGVYDEALMVARNFLAFRRGAGWPLRLKAKDVMGGPLESGAHWILPGRDKEGRGIFVFNVGKIDTRKASLEKYQQVGAYLVERFTRDEEMQRTGLVMIVNLASVPFGLCRALVSLKDAKRGIRMWQDAFPCKLKRIYVVGGSLWLLRAMRLVVAMLGKKLQNRVRVLPHLEALHRDVDRDNIPPCLGGSLERFEWGEWVAKVAAHEREEKDPVWTDRQIDVIEGDCCPRF